MRKAELATYAAGRQRSVRRSIPIIASRGLIGFQTEFLTDLQYRTHVSRVRPPGQQHVISHHQNGDDFDNTGKVGLCK